MPSGDKRLARNPRTVG